MDLQLSKKVIIVTGGAKGIGAAVAEVLASVGAIPVIIGRNKADNQELVDRIIGTGGDAWQFTAELSSPIACKDAVQAVIDQFDHIDGLVNNAGLNDGVGLENGSYEKFIQSMHENLIHYYLIAHHALPALIESKGAIVNVTSKVAETGQGNTSAYAAANGGRNALTREWAVELLKYSIRVNAVVVAECLTPAYQNWVNKFQDPVAKLKEISSLIPFENRMTAPGEIANTIVFLLSPRSGHTTGQLIHVDGGYVHLDRALIQ